MSAVGETKGRLLSAARTLVLERGLTAATVERICAATGLTKGAFFHYFDTKDGLARAVAEDFATEIGAAFAQAPFRMEPDPVRRLHAYVDFTDDLLRSPLFQNGCLIGALSLEAARTHPDVQAVCRATFTGWADDLTQIVAAAMLAAPPAVAVSPPEVAQHFVATVEGGLILARAHDDASYVSRSLDSFRAYLRALFPDAQRRVTNARTRARR